jgi:hypothetical protein
VEVKINYKDVREEGRVARCEKELVVVISMSSVEELVSRRQVAPGLSESRAIEGGVRVE